jgi:hypothetical protein
MKSVKPFFAQVSNGPGKRPSTIKNKVTTRVGSVSAGGALSSIDSGTLFPKKIIPKNLSA